MALDYRNLSRDEMIHLLESRERALLESAEVFAKAFRASPDAISVTNLQTGKFLDVNEGFERFFGFKREEVIGHTSKELGFWAIADDRERMVELIRNDGSMRDFQTLGRTRSGAMRICLLSAESVEIAGCKSVVLIVRDITERKKSEQALRESEERFRNLSAAAFEGICISENGKIVDVNHQFLPMFGYEREEIIGKQIIELVAPESRAMVTEAIRTGREKIYGHHLLRKDGTVFMAEAQAKMASIGDQSVRMTALRDVTDRDRAERALRESEERFRGYFEQAIVGCAITSMDKGIVAVNEQLCQMLGYSRGELLNLTWPQFTHPDDIAADAAACDRVIAGETDSYMLDKRYVRKDGSVVHATIAVRCIRRPDGSPDYFIGLAQDVTERREAIMRERQARLEYTLQLIASQEAERTRIARELHDSLGQNLLLIKNQAQLAQLQPDLPAATREQLEQMGRIAMAAINEVRQISHDLHPYQLDHLGLTRALEAMIDAAAESSGILFKHKLDSVDDVFTKDAAMNFYRAVQESLNNILKHSRAKHTSFKLERDVREIELRIEDDGCGFKFEKDVHGVKGLGLKNITERVRMLGGKIKIDSQPGHGTCIEITIPIGSEGELKLEPGKKF